MFYFVEESDLNRTRASLYFIVCVWLTGPTRVFVVDQCSMQLRAFAI